jgi:hypothetical protein
MPPAVPLAVTALLTTRRANLELEFTGRGSESESLQCASDGHAGGPGRSSPEQWHTGSHSMN